MTGQVRRAARHRRPGRGDRGSSALELSIVAPAVLLIIFFIVQVALWLYGRNVALSAAREGVSTLRMVQPTSDVQAARVRVSGEVSRYAVTVGRDSLLDPAATTTYDPAADQVTVTVTGRAVSLIPGLHLTVTRTAAGRIETFETDQ